jgi:hypothetical protein
LSNKIIFILFIQPPQQKMSSRRDSDFSRLEQLLQEVSERAEREQRRVEDAVARAQIEEETWDETSGQMSLDFWNMNGL